MNGVRSMGSLLGIGSDQGAALALVLILPAVIALFLSVGRTAARRGSARAARFVRGFSIAPLSTRQAAVLMLITAAVHLGLAPSHAEQGLGGLFVLDALAFAGLSVAAFVTGWWRPAAAVLLGATLLAYAAVVGAGREAPDQLGIATKLVELTALGLVLVPRSAPVRPGRPGRLGWAAVAVALLFFTTTSGAAVWVASIGDHHAAGHQDGLPAPGATLREQPDSVPTAAQQAAAARLVAETAAAVERYRDPAIAVADGYHGGLFGKGQIGHWENPAYKHDGRVLDPARPEELVYVNGKDGPVLAGVVYVMPDPDTAAPDVGGPITRWHTHSLCVSPLPPFIAGVITPFGTCLAGAINIVTPEMMHVWIVDNPGGAFAQELDPDVVKRLAGSSGQRGKARPTRYPLPSNTGWPMPWQAAAGRRRPSARAAGGG